MRCFSLRLLSASTHHAGLRYGTIPYHTLKENNLIREIRKYLPHTGTDAHGGATNFDSFLNFGLLKISSPILDIGLPKHPLLKIGRS